MPHVSQRPSAPVTVSLAPFFAFTDLVFSPSAPITIEPDTWATPQRVVCTVPQDNIDEGVFYTDGLNASLACAAGTDDDDPGNSAEFNGWSSMIPIRVIDDDDAGVVLRRDPLKILVDAAGACFETATYTLSLTSQPTANVTIAMLSSTHYLSLSTDSLTFSPDRWNTSRAVEVCARSPKVEAFVAPILHNLSSADPYFAAGAFTPPNATARVGVRLDGLPAPTLKRVQFFDSGAGATIAFHDDTNRAELSGVWPCEKLFNNSRGAFAQSRGPGIGYLGSDPSCAWADAATVLLTFGGGATALPRHVCYFSTPIRVMRGHGVAGVPEV